MEVKAEWIFGDPSRDYILHYENPQLDGPRRLALPLVLVPPEYTREESLVLFRMQRVCLEPEDMCSICDQMRQDVSKRKLACATMELKCSVDSNGDTQIEGKMIGRRLTREFLELERAYDAKYKPDDTECRVYLMKKIDSVALCLVLLLFFYWILYNVRAIKVYDVFTYNCEHGLLEWRLKTLSRAVDFFIIAEGQETFQRGEPKERCLLSDPLYLQYKNQILYLQVPPSGKNRPWLREKFARDYCLKALDMFNVHDNDLVISADVDEVPRPEIVTANHIDLLGLELDYFKYNMSNKQPQVSCKATIGRARHYRKRGLFRDKVCLERTIKKAGWHCSFCFMSENEIQRKLETYSHEGRPHYTGTF